MNNNTRKNRKGNGNGMNTMTGGYERRVGSKAQVWHGTAHHTSGGLTKKQLMRTKAGRIVSRRKHALGKKALKTLKRMGYVAKKGTFKLFRKGMRTMKRRGGFIEIPGIEIKTTTSDSASASASGSK